MQPGSYAQPGHTTRKKGVGGYKKKMMDKKEIRIVTGRSSSSLLWASHLRDELEKRDISSSFLPIEKGRSASGVEDLSGDFQDTSAALLRGDAELGVFPLDSLPLRMPEGLVITALSERADPAAQLLIRKQIVVQKLLKLPEAALLGVSNPLQKALLRQFRPDLRFQDMSGVVPDDQIDRLQKAELSAIVAPLGLPLEEGNLSELEVLSLHPREFIPPPGRGVLAYLACQDDLATRRLLKKVHHSEVAELTNIERKVQQLSEREGFHYTGVYCEADHLGNYHVWAALADHSGQLLSNIRHSSSTRLQLAEEVWKKLSEAEV
jgi:hydroxymethylbilane synthase